MVSRPATFRNGRAGCHESHHIMHGCHMGATWVPRTGCMGAMGATFTIAPLSHHMGAKHALISMGATFTITQLLSVAWVPCMGMGAYTFTHLVRNRRAR